MENKTDVNYLLHTEPHYFIKKMIKSESLQQALKDDGSQLTKEHISFRAILSVNDICIKHTYQQHYYFSDDIIDIMQNSNANNLDYFRLPSGSVFINNKIYLKSKDTWITGLLIVDNNSIPTEYALHLDLKPNNIGIYYFGVSDGCMIHGYVPNATDMVKEDFEKNENLYFVELYNFIHSTLNLLNIKNDDIISFNQDNTERNIKREKRKKATFPQKVKYVKLGGKTKAYTEAYRNAKNSMQYKTHVNGFFRTYKDDKYVNMQGKTQWIFPFVKGADLPERPELQLVKVSATEEFIEKIKSDNNG